MGTRTLAGLGALLALLAPSAGSAQPWDEGRLKTAYGNAVLFIEGEATFKAPNVPKAMWSGTGFIVHDRGWILTNHHVTQPGTVPLERIAKITLHARPGSGKPAGTMVGVQGSREAAADVLSMSKLPDPEAASAAQGDDIRSRAEGQSTV